MPRLQRLPLVLLLLAAACSKKPAQNYRNCLKMRVGMTREMMTQVMGEPESTIPYVEGKSLPHLQGRTGYEWRTPGAMAAPIHISFDDAAGSVASIRCGDTIVNTVFVPEPPPEDPAAPSDAPAAVPAPAVPAPAAAPGASRFPGSVVIAVGTGPAARRATASLGDGRFSFRSSWTQEDGDRMLELNGDAATAADGSTELDYALTYTVKPPEGKGLAVNGKGKVKVPAQGQVELKSTSDGPVTLSAFQEVP